MREREEGSGKREAGRAEAEDLGLSSASQFPLPASRFPLPAIRMVGIDKSFGAIQANRGASLEGWIHNFAPMVGLSYVF